MIGFAAAAALSFSGNCVGGLCNAEELRPFFTKLTHAAARPVHILQIGDSHTAGDAITGAWRDLLQQKYGSAGRGVLPPGRPYNGYLTHGITATMSPGWRIASDFGSAWSQPSPPLGLSAFTLTSTSEGATMALTADPTEAFDRFTVCAIVRPGAGSLTLRAGVDSVTFNLASVTERPECRTLQLTQTATTADLTVSGGPATLTSWATFRGKSGVTLSNLGVVSSQLMHWARTDDAVLAEELGTYRPDLIVLAFGTNEGFAPRFNSFEYEVTLRTQIGRIRRLAGNVPILLLGAPDALSRRPEMRSNAPGEQALDCGAPVASAQPVARESVIGTIMDRLRNSIGMTPSEPPPSSPPPPPVSVASGTSRGSLFPPAALAAVRASQRSVASSLNVAFWDWEGRMGGRCTADRWVHANPPLMRTDYVHYTSAGGREIAQRLQDDLDKAAAR
ncbi:GDSL-type esterase/lipase family protein [Sphingomonas crusticola]|uniref:GDSL-type esterase/lipase family protein n=1 Tax=Sphingomonas crusticola TaxID=1697973 RepID=UPI000E26444A|nr:GDSL-type esterase/lipase family protein [Sphingomonas crusticola]